MQKRSSITGGIILIATGVLFLLLQMYPALADSLNIGRQWPLIIVGVGVFFLIGAMGKPQLTIPGSVLSGIGGILYYQNLSGNWASWAYVWTLIPGFVGIGLILAGVLERKNGVGWHAGIRLMVISLVLFAIFAVFFNGLGGWGQLWPVLLILAGVWLVIQNRRAR